MKKMLLVIIVCLLTSCRIPDHSGFYQPITIPLASPDGSPEYKAGWHAGCRAALSQKHFSNAWVRSDVSGPYLGSGVYQHDKAFQVGFGQAIFACWGHMLSFVEFNAMQYGPLQ